MLKGMAYKGLGDIQTMTREAMVLLVREWVKRRESNRN